MGGYGGDWVVRRPRSDFTRTLSIETLMWRGFADDDWAFFGDSHTVLNKIRQF